MKYYKISIISSPLEPFVYRSKQNIENGVIVDVVFNNREAKGVVISTCQKPEFQTSDILGVNDFYFSLKQSSGLNVYPNHVKSLPINK